MSATEQSNPSPRNALSKLRRNKGLASASTNSLASASTDPDEPERPEKERGGLRASVDAAMEKVKARRRSVDERASSAEPGSNRLANLIARKPRPSKKGRQELQRNASSDSGQRDLSISANRSESSLVNGSGSSLLTDDNSDIEGKPIVRPTLSPHQSHAGYLTLSSPELNAHTRPVVTETANAQPDEAHTSVDAIADLPRIVEPSSTEPLPDTSISNRAPAAAEKLRSAFTLPRKRVGGDPGGDTDSVKSAGGAAGALGGLFRPRSRSNSVNSQALDDAQPIVQPVPDPDVSVPESASDTALAQEGDAEQDRPETPKRRGRGRINTATLPATPPNLVETPTTLVTPPTPTDPHADASTFPSRKPVTSTAAESPPKGRPLSSVESIRHRRAQSANLPSKLSNSIAAPLTPTVEETKTPGGTLTQPTNASGFFSSFFSAAQKAADQLSNNINTINAQNKGKGTTSRGLEDGGEETIPGAESGSLTTNGEQPRNSVALDTLGQGNLSLSHLGISESQDPSPMTSTTDLPQQDQPSNNDGAEQKAEEEAAARAVSVAYDKPVQSVVSQATGRPLSVASTERLTLNGDQTPQGAGNDLDSLKRSGSVRSRISGRRRRHRASSATTATGNTIAAAIQASNAALANPSANGAGHRLTGFAVASSKRNKDFHQLFRSVPEDDYLIEDYSAALQRDILLHGRLYVSEGHICFSSNILGWVTNLVINFDEVVSVEKKSTAVIFPNAIVIQTLHARNTFASFVARDSTYELLIGIWKISHPNLKSSLNGVTLDDAGTGDKTEVADPEGSDEESVDGSDDEVYDEDQEDDGGSFTDGGTAFSAAGSDIGDVPLSRKTSAAPIAGATQTNGVVVKATEAVEAVVTAATGGADFPGPQSHPATECADSAEHYDRPLTDTTIPAPLGKVYSLVFGPQSGAFMRKWLVDDQKSRELNYPDDKIGLDNDHKTVVCDYIKPLNAPVGPKQTKCITTYNLQSFDLEKAVTVDCSTQTPDVPSGNVFTTKTRYCLMWGPGNSTRMVANCTIEWTGKSWLKGPIESGATAGQTEYVKSLIAAVKAAVPSKPAPKGGLKKGRRKGRRETIDSEAAGGSRETAVAIEQKAPNWGVFEPIHQILEPMLAIIRPFITSQVIIAVLFVLLVYTWFVPPYRSGSSTGLRGFRSPERLAAYEQIWQKEESELWDWLEDRAGLDHLYAPSTSDSQRQRQRTLAARNMGSKLDEERMSERQMDDAVSMTEERLAALKEALARKKARKRPKQEL